MDFCSCQVSCVRWWKVNKTTRYFADFQSDGTDLQLYPAQTAVTRDRSIAGSLQRKNVSTKVFISRLKRLLLLQKWAALFARRITTLPCFHCPSRLLQVWIVYHSKMKTKRVYLQDSTYATPFSLLVWGARVRHERQRGKKHAVEVVIGERTGKKQRFSCRVKLEGGGTTRGDADERFFAISPFLHATSVFWGGLINRVPVVRACNSASRIRLHPVSYDSLRLQFGHHVFHPVASQWPMLPPPFFCRECVLSLFCPFSMV